MSACATASQPRSTVATEPTNKLEEATCRYIGLEDVSGRHDDDVDAVSLRAVYRFGDSSAGREPLSFKFQVDRARRQELRDYLTEQPEVICAPEGGVGKHVNHSQVGPLGVR
ncbi:MAG TPA: hypothetical protein VGI70_21600 [Polyangiales bacterium]